MPSFFKKIFFRSVPFSHLRHNDSYFYVIEGYGGKPIEAWPVYTFFCQYLNGEKDLAQKNFEEWYKAQLQKYHNIPKEEGGMYKGSLYTLIEKRSKEKFSNTSEKTIQIVITERVKQRFALLDSIKINGYNLTSERIYGVRKRGCVYIYGGHHRAAALRALGHNALPMVLVFPGQLVYNLFCSLNKIRHGYF